MTLTIDLTPSRDGLLRMRDVFIQEITKAEKLIQQAEGSHDFLVEAIRCSSNPGVRALSDMVDSAVEALIAQEQDRILAMKSGIEGLHLETEPSTID